MFRPPHLSILAIAALLLAAAFAPGKITFAATPLVVNTTADNATGGDDDCTLREAITNINAQTETSGGDCINGNGNSEINFNVNSAITLSSALPNLDHDMLLDGGTKGVTISGNDSARLFVINFGYTVGLRRLTLTNGRAPNGTDSITLCTAGAPGGAIYNAGTLNLHEVRITASRAGTGGNSLNQAGCRGGDGGAIFNTLSGTLNAYRSTFDNNEAGYGGDSGNGNGGRGADGGAIYNSDGGFVWLQNVTLTRNDRGYGGAGTTGGLHGDGPEIFHNGSAMTLVFTTVWDNHSLGTLVSASGKTIVLRNSLLQNSGQNCSLSLPGTFTDAGYNIENGVSCGFSAAGSLSGTPSGLLTTLQDNGGYVPTLALNSTSTAIDRLNDGVNVCGSGGITDDARGVARPKNAKCDIGAYEYIGMPGTNFVVNHAFGFSDGYCDTLGTGFGSQDCTFYEAVDAANATPGYNTITFDIPDNDPDCNTPDVCFIALYTQPSPLSDDVTIDASAQHITLSGEYGNRILEVNANITATVNALTIRYGRCYDCRGGGIWNKGNLTVTNSTLRDNAALGDDNVSDDGGGIFNQGALNISNSTFTENDADDGGAIFNSGGSLTMTNVTVANNSADVVGGIFSTTPVTIHNTVSSNNSGGDCSSPFNNTGANNLASDATCGATFTQKTVAEINLQGIADNGGSTFTMALLYPSAALDAGDNTVCANAPINNLDQRGEARPQDGDRDSNAVCDIGAYEAPIPPPTQSGPNFVVNHAADTDDGLCDVLNQGFFNKDCTLREAINAANARSGADTITFNIPDTDIPACSAANHCTITLDSTLPALNDTTTIDGSANTGDITISGDDAVRVFYINSNKTVTLDTLTITDAWCDAACDSGAGIRNHGALTVKNSAIIDNKSQYSGGGIYSESATLEVINSTIANNEAGGAGGGIISYQGGATFTNSTIVGNSAGTLGSGVYVFLGTLTMNNTLIAGNTGAYRDCDGAASGSNNLIQDSANACGLSNGVNGNIIGGNPNLAALGENGGPTQTIALQYPSDAIDAGDNTTCANAPINYKDQRGSARPMDGNGDSNVVCDVGAYEAPAFTGTQSGPNFVVNSAADTDDGFCDVLGQGAGNKDCTLREAINAANALSGADTIQFQIPNLTGCTAPNVCTITLSALGSLPAINGNLTIDGSANNANITVSGADSYRVLLVNNGIVFNLYQLTIAHGTTIGNGGGLDNEGGTVTITNSTFAYNSATSGSGKGGAIYNTGMLTVRSSTFNNNTSPYYGAGAIHSDAGTVEISNSTFNQNDGQGGGTIVNNATLKVWNSTISGNNFGITSSSAATLKNTIVADNTDGDCYGTITADTYNIDTDGSCNNATQKTVPQLALGALQNNGGTTDTMALGNSSAAIDAGADAVCAALPVSGFDQRGEVRDDLQCDVGAFELQYGATPPNSNQVTVEYDTTGTGHSFGPALTIITPTAPTTTTPINFTVTISPTGTLPPLPPGAVPIPWDAAASTTPFSIYITLCYLPGVDPTGLHVYHYNGGIWDDLGGVVDTVAHAPYACVTSTKLLESLSPLALAPGAPTSTVVTGVKGLVNKNGNIVLRWKTTSESQIAGFNIYRQGKQGEWKQLNANLRQAKHAGAALGDKYRFIDRQANADKTYRYKIEIVFLDGHSEWTNVIRVNRK